MTTEARGVKPPLNEQADVLAAHLVKDVRERAPQVCYNGDVSLCVLGAAGAGFPVTARLVPSVSFEVDDRVFATLAEEIYFNGDDVRHMMRIISRNVEEATIQLTRLVRRMWEHGLLPGVSRTEIRSPYEMQMRKPWPTFAAKEIKVGPRSVGVTAPLCPTCRRPMDG